MAHRKYTDQQFSDAVQNNSSVRAVLKQLGLQATGGNYKSCYARVKDLALDTSHWLGQGHLKNKQNTWHPEIPLAEILVENSNYKGNGVRLKRRLIRAGLLVNYCNNCGLTDWLGESINLHLDHKNGNNTDNRIENLRLLCPNCHSQTPTYCGKNKGRIQSKN